MDEEYWNLDQALAWVVFRDSNIIKTLQTVSEFSRATYFSDFITPYDSDKRPEYAKTDQLLTLLRSGRISAYGHYGDDTKNREEIPASSWIGLEFKTIMRQPAFANPTGRKGLRWNEILLKKIDIKTFFLSGGKNKALQDKEIISELKNLPSTTNDLYGKIGDKAREWLENKTPSFNKKGKMQPHGSNAAMCRWIIEELRLEPNQFQTVRDYSREEVKTYKRKAM